MAQKRRQPEIIAGRVNADGSIAAGDGFTVQKGTTGLYTILLPAGFRTISATVSGNQTNQVAGINPNSATQLSVATFFATTGALVDLAFGFVAVGVQT